MDHTCKWGGSIYSNVMAEYGYNGYDCVHFFPAPTTIPQGELLWCPESRLGGCPTLFTWSGAAYVDYGVINIHNPMGGDVIRAVAIKPEDVAINNFYKANIRLREGWSGLNFSESFIDQVKLYVQDSELNFLSCPLTEATHSEFGNILPQLLFSDNQKTHVLLLETLNLTFIVPYQNVQNFTFIIEGCNPYKI